MPLEVIDFVTRGCATNICLYNVHAPVAKGEICNASQALCDDDDDDDGDNIDPPIARRTPTDKNLSFESILAEYIEQYVL